MTCPTCSKPLGTDRFCIGPLTAPHPAVFPENHRDQFAEELEEAARLLKHGTHEDLTEFANRGAKTRAKEAAERAFG